MEFMIALQLLAFQHDGGVAFKLPTAGATWVEVDDAAGTCAVRAELASDADGTRLAHDAGETFYSAWGVVYERAAADGGWTAQGRGTWIADHEPELGWSRAIVPDGESNAQRHYGLWQGDTLVVANDPRYGENTYHPEARFKLVWFAIEGNRCTVHLESMRRYAEPGLQTVDLNGLTLSTGRAERAGTRLIGNWVR